MLDLPRAERAATGTGISISERLARTCINLRGVGSDARFARAVAAVTDLELPLDPGASVSGLLASVLWLGPDEWLVVSETQAAAELVARLRQALSDLPSAVTDVGEGYIVYALSGPSSRDVLAKGCSVDLHPRAFTPGRCARSLLAKVPMMIHLRAADPTFELYVARSYREYAWTWLMSAAGDYLQPG
jgi:sarcosine oxidase, subunit gamma